MKTWAVGLFFVVVVVSASLVWADNDASTSGGDGVLVSTPNKQPDFNQNQSNSGYDPSVSSNQDNADSHPHHHKHKKSDADTPSDNSEQEALP